MSTLEKETIVKAFKEKPVKMTIAVIVGIIIFFYFPEMVNTAFEIGKEVGRALATLF